MDKLDRRIEKTRMAIYQALDDLLQEKKYTNITIQEIVDQANVGRTTFYSHFADKDELLNRYVEIIFERLTKQVPAKYANNFIPVTELFVHIQENSRLITGILMSESGELLLNKFKNYWNEKIELYLLEQLPKGKQPKVPIDVLTNYVTGTLTELIKWWIRTGKKYTPEQMEQYIHALISPSFSSVM